jgi:serine/threonine-protein kinase RsbW
MIGDVAGHDRQAAAQMGHLRIAARMLSGRVRGPAALIGSLRRGWRSLEMDRMATALFCQLDLATGDLVVASAGHPAPLVVTKDGAAFLPVKPSTPLGGPRSRVLEWRGVLGEEEALLLYTDGVIHDRDRLVGVDDALSRLVTLASTCSPDPAVLCERVQSAMGSDRSDDVALLSLVRTPV